MNRITAFLAGVAVLATLAVLSAPAHAQIVYNGHTYQLTSTALSWTAAEAQAVSLGGHLVTINDAAEQSFLNTTFNTSAVPLWTGLNDAAAKGTFVWSSGEAVTYTNWQPGEPSNSGGNEDYVAMNWHVARGDNTTVGTWNDAPLNGTVGYGGNTDGPYRGVI